MMPPPNPVPKPDTTVTLETGEVVIGKCRTYEERPQRCQDYPQAGDERPPSCTYDFVGGQRTGTCQPEVCSVILCCSYLRAGGEPEGEGTPYQRGGLPCKNLYWTTVKP